MDKNKDLRSNFVSIPGILFLLALCIVSTYFKINGLPLFLFFVLLLVTVAFFWGRSALQKLDVELIGESVRVFPGEDICFNVIVSNKKLLPLLWLETELPRPEDDYIRTDEGFFRRFTWLMPWQSLTWENRWTALHRGVGYIDQVILTSGDGMGLSVDSLRWMSDNPVLLIVYPEIFPVNTQGFLQDTAELQPSKTGYHEDSTLLRSSRSYQPGDNSRHINWRVLARQGEITVNLYEHLNPRRISFFLDLASFTTWKSEETSQGPCLVLDEYHKDKLEKMISLTASCIVSLSEQSVNCALIQPYTTKQSGFISRPDGEDAVTELLTHLAALKYNGEPCKFPMTEIHRNSHKLGMVYVICESPVKLTCQDTLDTFEENRVCILSFEPDVSHPIYKVRELQDLQKSLYQ